MQRTSRPGSFNKKQPVEDLRVKLNRKREEKGTADGLENTNLPPPDPSYNFLKDPLRGDSLNKSERKFPPKFRRPFSDKKGNWRDEGNSETKLELKQPKAADSKVENQEAVTPKSPQKPEVTNHPASNIKIEVTTSGARKCIIDETKVVEVPKIDEPIHRPDRKPQREAQKLYVSKGKQRSQSFNETSPRNANDKEFAGGNYRKRYMKREPRKENIKTEEGKENEKREGKAQNSNQEKPKRDGRNNCDDM